MNNRHLARINEDGGAVSYFKGLCNPTYPWLSLITILVVGGSNCQQDQF